MQRLIVLCSIVVAALGGAHAPAADTTGATALKSALTKSAQHAARWLDERDFKSLAQSTGSLTLLTETLQSKGDDPDWQTAVAEVLAKARDLQRAARDENQANCQATLAALEDSLKRLDKREPAGKPQQPPRAAIRPLMLTLDSVQADAKFALLTGDAAAAKNQAAVLAELARLVSNSRTGEPWTRLADDFQHACQAVATSAETDAKAVRQLLRGIAQRCDACHENSRQR